MFIVITHLLLKVQDATMHGSLPLSIVDLCVGTAVSVFFQLCLPGGGSFKVTLNFATDVLCHSLLI